MCGGQILIRSMSSPRKRRNSQIVAEDGHAAVGKRGRSQGKEKNGNSFRVGRAEDVRGVT